MKLWISGEIEAEIGDDFRKSRNSVEKKVNEFLKDKLYQIDFSEWDCIAIIRNDNSFPEIHKYSKKKKEMDFRLKIDFNLFKNASSHIKESMVFEMLLRSLNLIKLKIENPENLLPLIADFKKFGKENNWFKEI